MTMNLQQIKEAVLAGKSVCWKNPAYDVIVDKVGQWLIVCNLNQSTIGLTWVDGITLNEAESDFYINEQPIHTPHPTADDFADIDAIAYGVM